MQRNYFPSVWRLVFSVWWLIAADPSKADQPLANYAFPAGGQRGTSVSIHVGLCNGNAECCWAIVGPGFEVNPRIKRVPETTWFEGPLLSLSESQAKEDYPKDYAGRVTIASEAALGSHLWRVWTSQGLTAAMPFVVGDLPEVIEDEIDGEPIPVNVTLPVTVNGRVFPREDVDVWSLSLTAGTTVTCEVHSARLGYPLRARLEVLDPHGQRIVDGTNNLEADVRVRFLARESGTYQVRIHDIRFGGSQSHVYRLTMTEQPYVDAVYPLGGRIGTTASFLLSGQQVPSSLVPLELKVEILSRSFPQPSWQRIRIADQWTNSFLVQLDDLPEYRETDDDSATQSTVRFPAVLNGRIRRPQEIDEWKFIGQRGDQWQFDLWAARLGSPLDSVLAIQDERGNELVRADDLGPGETDSQRLFAVPADGIYTVRIAEQFQTRGGERFAYRLRVAPAVPDFQLQLATGELTVLRGGEAAVKVVAKRHGGFEGGIAVKAENLSPGVTASATVIAPNAAEAEWTFRADATAKIQLSQLRVVGEAIVHGEKIHRLASLPAVAGALAPTDLALMVGLPTPFKFTGRTSIEYVPCGSTLQWHFRLDRNGFEGPIDVELSDRQFRHLMGMTASRITVPPGVTEFDFPIQVPPRTLLGRTGRAVIVVSGTVAEPDGTPHTVSFSTHNDDDQVVVLASAPLLTLDSPRKTLTAQPGGRVSLPLQLQRSNRLNESEVAIELVAPKHVRGVSARRLTLSPTETSGEMQLEFAKSSLGPWNAPLTVRATAQFQGQPVVAEFLLTIVDADGASSPNGP